MDALSVTSLGTTTPIGAKNLLPLAVPPTPQTAPTTLDFAAVAQGLLQPALQEALADTPSTVAGLSGALGASGNALLASLATPQAAASTPQVQAPAATQGTAQAAASAATPLTTPTTGTDSRASSATSEFALQTALRFGAGVGALAPAIAPTPTLQAPLVRDAVAVPRLEGLQTREGGTGEGAPRQPQAPPQALQAYGAASRPGVVAAAPQVDLLV